MELLDLNPWIIRVDKEKSSEYYFNNDLSEDKIFNTELIKILDKATLEFIFAGYFEAIPSDQWDFYFDYLEELPPIFAIDKNTPERIVIDNDYVSEHELNDKMGIYRFSPASAYDDSFEGWNSGYIFCKVLFRT